MCVWGQLWAVVSLLSTSDVPPRHNCKNNLEFSKILKFHIFILKKKKSHIPKKILLIFYGFLNIQHFTLPYANLLMLYMDLFSNYNCSKVHRNNLYHFFQRFVQSLSSCKIMFREDCKFYYSHNSNIERPRLFQTAFITTIL